MCTVTRMTHTRSETGHSRYCIANALAAIRESNSELAPADQTAASEAVAVEWMRDGIASDACVCAGTAAGR